uniref:Uncharacterized protein n=1 Tax=viral metagenome TaxID=1070528 RepID=A0A6M3XLC0_9ZZZZ
MLDRREFLKKAAKMAGGGAFGLAAMHSFGMGAVKDAMGCGILPAVVGSGSANRWPTWNESNEVGLASPNTLVWLFENTNASENETGQGGGLSGVNLVLTQSGSVPGATGSPPYRQLTEGSSQFFTPTVAALNALLLGQDQWTIIVKMNTHSSDTDFVWDLRTDSGVNARIAANILAAREITFSVNGENLTTTDKTLATGDLWVAMWRKNGANKGGFATTRPITEASFDATKLVTATGTDVITGSTFAVFYSFFNVTTYFMTAKIYYVVVSKTCLL